LTRIALVVAVAENGVIGAGGALPWRIADDLKWFKSVTLGKPVVMGRKTFQSIGKPLPGRRNIVVTRDPRFAVTGVETAPSIDAAFSLARSAAHDLNADKIAVIGGGDIYAQTLPRADRIYLTHVAARPVGDAHFPPLDPSDWRTTPRGGTETDWSPGRERNQYACRFFVLDRIRGAEMAEG
jgi:dihydrofolate reductase